MPDPKDMYEVHGGTVGAMSEREWAQYVDKNLRGAASMLGRIRNAGRKLENSYSSDRSTNDNDQPKYLAKPGAYSIGGGVVSGDKAEGTFVVSPETTKKTNPVFSIGLDTLYSQAKETVLGSTNIRTLENEIMSPLFKEIPSTHFTPLKGWMDSFLPSTPWKSLLLITVVEGILVLILKEIFERRAGEDTDPLPNMPDLGMTIIDNKELEEKFLASRLRR